MNFYFYFYHAVTLMTILSGLITGMVNAQSTNSIATTITAAQAAYTTALNNYSLQDNLNPQNPINLNNAINGLAQTEAVYAAFLRKTAPVTDNTKIANVLDANMAYEKALYTYNQLILTADDGTVEKLATTLATAANAYITALNSSGQASDATTATAVHQDMLDAGIF